MNGPAPLAFNRHTFNEVFLMSELQIAQVTYVSHRTYTERVIQYSECIFILMCASVITSVFVQLLFHVICL